MTIESAMCVLLFRYQGTVLRIPVRTSRATTSESRTAQLSRERRRPFADDDINVCSGKSLCAKTIRHRGKFSFQGIGEKGSATTTAEGVAGRRWKRELHTCVRCITIFPGIYVNSGGINVRRARSICPEQGFHRRQLERKRHCWPATFQHGLRLQTRRETDMALEELET